MDNSHEKQTLVDHVQNKRIHHVRHVLRQRDFTQQLLDESLHAATRTGQVETARLLLEHGANVHSLNSKGAPVLLGTVLGDHVDIITLLVIYHYDINYAIGDSIDTGIGVPLHIAIWKHNIHMVRVLIEAGICLETRDQDGNTALLVSAYADQPEITEILLKTGCNANAQDSTGNTITHIAVAVGSMNILDLGLQYANPDIPNDDGDTPFLLSIRYRNIEMMGKIMTKSEVDIHHINAEGCNALHHACLNGSADILQMLLVHDVDLNHIDRRGSTPLLAAAICGHESAVIALLPLLNKHAITRIGYMRRNILHWSIIHNMKTVFKFALDCKCFDINAVDQNDDNALVLAIQHRQLDMVKILIHRGANVAPKRYGSYSPAHWAIKVGDVKVLQLLIKHGANLLSVNKRIENCLLMAVRLGLADFVSCILDSVGDIDRKLLLKQKDVGRRSCLHVAVEKVYINILQVLLPFYEDYHPEMVESLNRQFETPLAIAGRVYSSDIIKLLLRHGSNCNVLDQTGRSPLYYSVTKKDESLFLTLLRHGADANFCKKDTTVLIEASKLGLTNMVQALLNTHAHVDSRDHQGRTALMWASQKGHTEVVDLLLEAKSDTSLMDNSGDTSLTISAFIGTHDVLMKLIPLSDLNHIEHEENMSALLLALSQEHSHCALTLLENGGDINIIAKNGNNSLLTAVAANIETKVVKRILTCGQPVDINKRGEVGRTALHWAVSNTASLQALLRLSPQLDLRDGNGATPLLLSVAHGMEQSALLLVAAGSNINMVYDDGRAIIHHAAIYGTPKLLLLLLKRDIEPEALTHDRRTPLLLACIEGHTQCVHILLDHGAKFDRIFFDAVTPLSVAANERNYETMEVLLSAGANPDLIGGKKHRPLVNCVINNDIVGVEKLLQWGADMDCSPNWMVHPIVIAAMNHHWNILKLLLATAQNINVVKHILQNGALVYFVTDAGILNELKLFCKCPVRLVKLCTNVIRSHIKKPLLQNISNLPVPVKIKDIVTNCRI